MERIIVNGGVPLFGEVTLGGSKNAALPILFSTVLMRGISVIENLPKIGDTAVALEILRYLGAKITEAPHAVYIDTRQLSYREPPEGLVSELRASTYLIGASLSRFGVAHLGNFGGCNFSKRPIDLHLLAAKALGAHTEDKALFCERLLGAEINLPKPSVGATVNSLLLSVSAKGESVIRGFAREPHIFSLIDFLVSAGAKITVTDTEIKVSGTQLSGGKIKIIGDMIEAGTYLAAGLVTGGEVSVLGVDAESVSAITDALGAMGAIVFFEGERITARRGRVSRAVKISAEPHPGFPTDLQPIMAPLLASFSGGVIRDFVWTSRFGYLEPLSKFGVRSIPLRGGCIIEKSSVHTACVSAPDLRAGAACLLCALRAEGESVIDSARTVLRGYESLAEKLGGLGARVKIEL